MVIFMCKKILSAGKKKERGDGGISYAMYFIAIVITLVMYAFFKFNADLFIIEEALENGLHIAETRVLTVNQDGLKSDNTRNDEYEREISRLHIVTKYSTTSNSPVESNQVKLLATSFSDAIKEQLNLNGSHPQSSILKLMCGSDADILIEKFVIYEPVYTRSVSKTSTGNITGTSLETFKFDVVYTIDNWIVYTVNFDGNNNYIGFTKQVKNSTDTPMLEKGIAAEGATIEATLGTKFKGVRNIFANINTTPPTVNEDAVNLGPQYNNLTADEYDVSQSWGSIFSGAPTQNEYSIKVTQSADIVVAHQDSRKQ